MQGVTMANEANGGKYGLGGETYVTNQSSSPLFVAPLTDKVTPFHNWSNLLNTTTTLAILLDANGKAGQMQFTGDTWVTNVSFLPILNSDTLFVYLVVQANNVTYYIPNGAPSNVPNCLTIMNLTLNSPKGIYLPLNSTITAWGNSGAGNAQFQFLIIGYQANSGAV